MIIDFLHDDKRTLRECSLVCSSWARSAQYHLFYSRRIEPRDVQAGYAQELNAVLHGPLRACVRELALTQGRIRSPLLALTTNILVDVLTNLPLLRSLKLRESGFLGEVPPTLQRRFELERLSISWMYPSTPGSSTSLLTLLSLFHTVRLLDLVVVHSKHLPDFDSPQPDTSYPYHSLRVYTLQFQGLSAHLLRSIQAYISLEHLETVMAPISNLEDIANLGHFIRKVGPGLHHLQLSFWMFWCNDSAGTSSLRHKTVVTSHIPLCIRLEHSSSR